jgi:hypothetical protein
MEERNWTRLSYRSLRILDAECSDMEERRTGERDAGHLSPTSERSLVLSESSQSSYISIENGLCPLAREPG